MTLELGADFCLSAALAVLSKPPQEALDAVAKMFYAVKTDMRARIDAAHQEAA